MAVLNYDARPPSKSELWLRSIWRRSRRYLAVAGIFFALYVASYLTLSYFGHYEPVAIGTNGIKWLDWFPAGFSKNFRPRRYLFRIYLPLWALDRRYWHTSDDWFSGKYPAHMPRDIDELRNAWK